jgi:hypothetical protein
VSKKISEFKIPDISLEETLANRAKVEFNDRLLDIYATENLSDFLHFAKLLT